MKRILHKKCGSWGSRTNIKPWISFINTTGEGMLVMSDESGKKGS